MATENNKWLEKRIEVCKGASKTLNKLRKRMLKIDKEFTKWRLKELNI